MQKNNFANLGFPSWRCIIFWDQPFRMPANSKAAGIAIHHSGGRILFYTAGSRKGLAAVATYGELEAVVKSAARATLKKTKSRGPRREREAPQPAAIRLPSRPGAALDLGPLDLVFLEAALAADFITASISLQKIHPRSRKHKLKKGSQIIKKGVCNFPNPAQTTKSDITWQTCIQIIHS